LLGVVDVAFFTIFVDWKVHQKVHQSTRSFDQNKSEFKFGVNLTFFVQTLNLSINKIWVPSNPEIPELNSNLVSIKLFFVQTLNLSIKDYWVTQKSQSQFQFGVCQTILFKYLKIEYPKILES
jgi:hypothetical protein